MTDIESTLRDVNQFLNETEAAITALLKERNRLRDELENERARGIHTCGPQCMRPACRLRRERDALREEVAALRQQPAPVVDDAMVVINGRRYSAETVRTALLGLAADLIRAQGVQS